ncbi:MAG: M14 family zinc carboxypeptidase [Planctomycetota bacterium]
MIRFFAPVLLAFFMIASNAAAHDTSIEDLLTVAEDSNFESTATSAEVVEFVEACASAAPHVRKHVFGQTVEGRDMVAAVVSTEPYVPGDETDQLVSLVFANIHSGECCGKEALLMLLRELTANPDHPWLEKMVVVLVPNYNADANDRMGPNNRPGQVGPVNGMGRRENAQELDLNRDFGKLESPEARSLISLMTLCDPDITIDCHTTNGSQQQYALTYAVPVNPACSQPLRDFMRNKMMPEVTETMEQKDWLLSTTETSIRNATVG